MKALFGIQVQSCVKEPSLELVAGYLNDLRRVLHDRLDEDDIESIGSRLSHVTA